MSESTELDQSEIAVISADDSPYGAIERTQNGDRVIYPTVDNWVEVGSKLLADGWNMCIDITAVDYKAYGPARNLPEGVAEERFEVVATLRSHDRRELIQARVQVSADNPVLPTLYNIFPGVDYAEREIYDLFGIEFAGHPDLSRILMPETWQGHPLRKDYAIGGIPVQFKAPTSTDTK